MNFIFSAVTSQVHESPSGMISLVISLAALLGISSVSSDCPSGWTAYTGTQLCIKGFDQQMAFVDAMDYCAALGNDASLVSIHNAFQNVRVATTAEETSPDCNFWIGLYNFGGSNNYSWTDGSVLDYQNWAEGYPVADIEDSMIFLDVEGKNKWVSTYNLIETKCFVCQQHSTQNPSTAGPPTSFSSRPTTTISPSGACPTGWHYYDGQCYYLDDTHVSHAEAEAFCARNGSTMVSITSAAEQAFVHSIISDCYCTWIGLVNENFEGWQWMDGSLLNYTNWASDCPSSENNPYAFMYITGGVWRDTSSAAELCILCKKSVLSARNRKTA